MKRRKAHIVFIKDIDGITLDSVHGQLWNASNRVD
ncbi:hypothetical protein J2S17_003151 [Cytobacillus purgationiresistens]|uniref:Uncharacterized protein n=1 Tax=Cytobacillus purgationiresistens TaxID=863449 RepID=A0ABU0ALJ5_9BACI|nr:hypothetical protein [Cytobacillus purgationiresistens]